MSGGCLGSVWEMSGGCLRDSVYFLGCNNVDTIKKNSLDVIWASHGLFSQWPRKGKNWPKNEPWSIGRTHFWSKIRLNMVHIGQLGPEKPMGPSGFWSWYHRGPPYSDPFQTILSVQHCEYIFADPCWTPHNNVNAMLFLVINGKWHHVLLAPPKSNSPPVAFATLDT